MHRQGATILPRLHTSSLVSTAKRQAWRAMSTEAVPVSPATAVDVSLHTEASTKSEAGSSKTPNSTLPKYHGIVVRPWGGISGMSDIFAVIRGIERKYGRIEEYSIVRDSDSRNLYGPFFWARFADPASYERISEGSAVVRVEMPIIDHTRAGGVGLDDVQDLLPAEEYRPDEKELPRLTSRATEQREAETGKKIEDVKIELMKTRYRVPTARRQTYANDSTFRRGFAAWDGFSASSPDAAPFSQPWMAQVRASNAAKLQGKIQTASATAEVAQTYRAQLVGNLSNYQERYKLDGAQQVSEASESDAASVPTSLDTVVPLQKVVEAGQFTEASSGEPRATTPAPSLYSTEGTPELSAKATEKPTSTAPAKPHLSRRERMLAQARENARTPLPSAADKAAQAEKARLEEDERKKEEERAKSSVRERLWKLMGERWF